MGFASNIFFLFAGGEPGPVSAGHRLFFKAVLGIARTGAPWRDGPARFGHGNSAGRRFDRGAMKATLS